MDISCKNYKTSTDGSYTTIESGEISEAEYLTSIDGSISDISCENNITSADGSDIIFDSKESFDTSTEQCIPDSLKEFDFSEGENLTSIDGSDITFDLTKTFVISTEQCIPDSLKEFDFKFEIPKFNDNSMLTFGLESDVSHVQFCCGTGEIRDEKGILQKVEPIDEQSIICCRLSRFSYFDKKYQILSVQLNDLFRGSWIIKGANLKPVISYKSAGKVIGRSQIKSYLGNCRNDFDTGKF